MHALVRSFLVRNLRYGPENLRVKQNVTKDVYYTKKNIKKVYIYKVYIKSLGAVQKQQQQ